MNNTDTTRESFFHCFKRSIYDVIKQWMALLAFQQNGDINIGVLFQSFIVHIDKVGVTIKNNNGTTKNIFLIVLKDQYNDVIKQWMALLAFQQNCDMKLGCSLQSFNRLNLSSYSTLRCRTHFIVSLVYIQRKISNSNVNVMIVDRRSNQRAY